MKINLNEITEKQLKTLADGVSAYTTIQSNVDADDPAFRSVFTKFYLSAQGKMRRAENQEPFFAKMRCCKKDKDLVELVEELYRELPIGKYEFSFATKLLHTVNPDFPIYDSKVRNYLKHEEGVNFWLYFRPRKDVLSQIRHDWALLTAWYADFLATARAKEWISWFDARFPNATWLSPTKKIDFIIFAWD